jgi:hypothetical protein
MRALSTGIRGVVLLSALVVSCSPFRETWVDTAAEVVVDGIRYRASGADKFMISRDALIDAGTADSTLPGLGPDLYRFPDIDASQALVIFHADGEPFLLVPATLMLPAPSAEGSEPIAAAIPELCRYWRPPKPSECGGG